jgi:hypothetical protein
MLHLLFMVMLIGFLGALVALPAMTARLVPWWGTLLIVLGELVFLRYTLFKILGLMFGIFTWVGIRIGVSGMRGARIDVHSVRVVPPPAPEEAVRRQSGSVDLHPAEDDAPEQREAADEAEKRYSVTRDAGPCDLVIRGSAALVTLASLRPRLAAVPPDARPRLCLTIDSRNAFLPRFP